jgi:hypothetical protein
MSKLDRRGFLRFLGLSPLASFVRSAPADSHAFGGEVFYSLQDVAVDEYIASNIEIMSTIHWRQYDESEIARIWRVSPEEVEWIS